jgi:hypothetical protein
MTAEATPSASHIELDDSPEAIEDYFYERGWTDGLPIVPPSPARVEAMLAWTDRAAGDEIGEVPPRRAMATVEAVAINAVMAGCRPEYLPVLIAAVEAMLVERVDLVAVQTTTHPISPLLVLNGPIARELSVNCSYGLFGPGWRANATIGRAIRLILLNIGGGIPGVFDHATHGQPSKYTYCIAENEEANPWEPLHVERGFAPDASAVTVIPCENPHELNDHSSSQSPGILTTLANGMGTMASNNAYMYGEPVLCLGPEHAAILAQDGYDKSSIREYIFEHARVPRETWVKGGCYSKGMNGNDFPGETAIPFIKRPEDLIVIVAGGPGRHSCWMPTVGSIAMSATKPIERRDGQPARSIEDFRPA